MTTYTLFKTKNGWIVAAGSNTILTRGDIPDSHVFESTKSLTSQLARIIDPEEARKIIAAMPKRGPRGKFLRRVEKAVA